ncbi:MAG TPA: poly(3-hydroxybutyrate) depolymerase, partial [Flavisolibacter sp.]|nr:poly(3-hydroxybutyrate) depolymerase [Flavisolibacter sp.]
KAGELVLGTVRSTKETFQYWAGLSGYKTKPQHDVLPDNNTTDSISIERYRYKKPGRPEVVLLEVVNGKHEFPKDINVFVEAWEFFKRQLKKS